MAFHWYAVRSAGPFTGTSVHSRHTWNPLQLHASLQAPGSKTACCMLCTGRSSRNASFRRSSAPLSMLRPRPSICTPPVHTKSRAFACSPAQQHCSRSRADSRLACSASGALLDTGGRGSGGEGRGGDGHSGGGHGGGAGDGSHDGQRRRDRGSWYTSPVLLAAVATVAVSAIVSRPSTVPNVPPTLGQIETAGEEAGPVDSFEEWFENALFSCRFFVLAAVLGSVAVSAMMFLKGSYEVWKSMTMFMRGNAHELTFKCIEAIDNYLTGTVLLIFGMGTYELFISKIDPAAKLNSSSNSRFSLDTKPRWLRIESLDDLKLKLGQVIVMIMLVNFFQQSKKMVLTEPLHLIFASGSTLLSSAAFSLSVWATHASHGHQHHHSTQHNNGNAH